MVKDIAASVRQKLRNLAQERREDFDYVLRQYAMQRLLYRLGCSEHMEHFLLKGALLFWVWNQDFHRPTRDIDLLTYTDNDVGFLVNLFRDIVSQDQDDGLIFDADTVEGIEIKEDADYTGVRITGAAYLSKARIPFQIDIGYGDVVVPAAEKAQIPSFLDMPLPELKIYPVYGVIAEKFQAMVMLGLANSRMKDFYDIAAIAHTMSLDGDILARAIKATFDRRKTDIEKEPLFIFSEEFIQDNGKHTQWKAFLNKNGINSSMEFDQVVAEVQQVIEPVYQSISNNESFEKTWDYEELTWQ
ncbi:MAG: nucleotidyl transferase AbiEii/AbiGii toxin family protein [Candidatus Thiodiazotropha endolucinida]